MKSSIKVLSTIAVAGLLAIGTAIPAQAHHNTISGEATCDNSMVTIFWTVENSEKDKKETILQSDGSPAIDWVGYKVEPGGFNVLKQHGITEPGEYTVSIKAEWDNGVTSGDSGFYTVTKDDIAKCAPEEPKLVEVKQPLTPYLDPICGPANDVWMTGGDPEGIEWKKSFDPETGIHLLWAEALTGYTIVGGETKFEGKEDATDCVVVPVEPDVKVTHTEWVEGAPDCELETVVSTRTTTRTTYVLTDNVWVPTSTDTVETTERATTEAECPTVVIPPVEPPVVTPPVVEPPVTVTPIDSLAYTGVNDMTGPLGLGALLFLIAGAGAMFIGRRWAA